MKFLKISALFILISTLSACIGDDFIADSVDREIRVLNLIDTLILGETYALDVQYLNNIGLEESIDLTFESSNPDVVEVSSSGEITGLQLGESTISITAEDEGVVVNESFDLVVGENRTEQASERNGTIRTTTFYDLEGTYNIVPDGDDLILTLNDDFKTTDRLPGLYVYLTNNNNSISGAVEISKVTQFEGEHSYRISRVQLMEFEYLLFWCKPFKVKVGEGSDNQ